MSNNAGKKTKRSGQHFYRIALRHCRTNREVKNYRTNNEKKE